VEAILLVRDFELGTRISDVLARLECGVLFADRAAFWHDHGDDTFDLAIVDLNDEEFGTAEYLTLLKRRYPELKCVGFLQRMYKGLHDRFRSAGCDVILPRSSLVKNLPAILKHL
jgi:DNA-binding NarL/FixJ family response regulator